MRVSTWCAFFPLRPMLVMGKIAGLLSPGPRNSCTACEPLEPDLRNQHRSIQVAYVNLFLSAFDGGCDVTRYLKLLPLATSLQ